MNLVVLQYRISGDDDSVRLFKTEQGAKNYAKEWLIEQYENVLGQYKHIRSLECVEQICSLKDIAYISITSETVQE